MKMNCELEYYMQLAKTMGTDKVLLGKYEEIIQNGGVHAVNLMERLDFLSNPDQRMDANLYAVKEIEKRERETLERKEENAMIISAIGSKWLLASVFQKTATGSVVCMNQCADEIDNLANENQRNISLLDPFVMDYLGDIWDKAIQEETPDMVKIKTLERLFAQVHMMGEDSAEEEVGSEQAI